MSSIGGIVVPATAEEAGDALAADPARIVLAGGTLVVPLTTLGSPPPGDAVWIGRAGLDAIDDSGARISIGAAATLAACTDLPAPLGPAARNIGDTEVRAQATIGGNICSPAPYGDLRGPLLALAATISRIDGDGGRTDDDDAASFFSSLPPPPPEGARLAGPAGLVTEIAFDRPSAGAFVSLGRHHTQMLTPAAISATRDRSGEVRLAATGMAPTEARRLIAAEAAVATGASPAEAGNAALADIEPYDDVLASASYRRRVAPALVARALEELGGP